MFEIRSLILAAAAAFILQVPVRAQLLVIEIQSSQSDSAPSGKSAYWELTNFGSTAVALGNYRWGDEARSFSNAVVIPAGTSIGAGESVIFTKMPASAFRPCGFSA